MLRSESWTLMTDITREIADLRQTEAFLLKHGVQFLKPIETAEDRAAYNLSVRIWWHVKSRREALELEAK
jgi:hypothetical protein